MPLDPDQSGNSWQKVRVYLGPTLGWSETLVRPTRNITSPGSFPIVPGESIVLVNVAGSVTLLLPDVKTWVSQVASQPATGFERSIWVKDLGGNASVFPITIVPFPIGMGSQTIDLIAASFTIVQNHQMLRLYPKQPELNGWWAG
jgi:hypothetical protein